MYLPPTHHYTRWRVFGTPTYDPDAASRADLCGTSGRSPCDDVPYMKAALDATICSGASPCQDVDPDKVFVTGESKDAGMATNLICDTRTSTYFRGASIVSESYPLRSPAGTGRSGRRPHRTARPSAARPTGSASARRRSTRTSRSSGSTATADSLGCNIGLPATCYDTGGVTDATDGTHWVWSIPQLAGDDTPATGQGATSASTDVAPGHALGARQHPRAHPTRRSTSASTRTPVAR